jgi:hypothetical protein
MIHKKRPQVCYYRFQKFEINSLKSKKRFFELILRGSRYFSLDFLVGRFKIVECASVGRKVQLAPLCSWQHGAVGSMVELAAMV